MSDSNPPKESNLSVINFTEELPGDTEDLFCEIMKVCSKEKYGDLQLSSIIGVLSTVQLFYQKQFLIGMTGE